MAMTLSEKIVASVGTGEDPTELQVLDAISGATIPSGTPVADITDASVAHALNATFSDTEVEAALNALGVKINLILDALDAFGMTA